MHTAVESTYQALTMMSTALQNYAGYGAQPYNQVWGWNQPSTSTEELTREISRAQRILSSVPNDANLSDLSNDLSQFPERLQVIANQSVPNIGNGAYFVVAQIKDELERLNKAAGAYIPKAQPVTDWEKLAAEGYLPKKLVARLTGMETRLNRLTPNLEDLEKKLSAIETAYETAEQLPESMQTLEDAKRTVGVSRTEAQSLAAAAATHARDASSALSEIEQLAIRAESKYADLEDAHRAASTKGLASAFQARAQDLSWSVRLWVSILVADLVAGAIVGILRFSELQKVLSSNQSAPVIWGNMIFSVLSLAAPVWLGWVATKQINQRFKLAEDYGFKATVAAAYEAWKSEAQKHDGDFAQRLFGSALSRIEEAPLRFLDKDNFGTPWQEFVSTSAFSKALDAIPDFKMAYAKFIAGAGAVTAAGAAATQVLNPKAAEAIDGGDGRTKE